ncbi:MAG: DUF1456 family protein [Proteobacteria bacterium]|nr:DUF1456 family protein [Pseudomonadota bacterium]
MTNNDILRRLRYLLNTNDGGMAEVFALVGHEITAKQVRAIMGKEDDPAAVGCTDLQLGDFLDGLIVSKRGPRDPDAPVPPRVELTNNEILKKLRIAFTLREDDIVRLLEKGGFKTGSGRPMAKGEVSALFRKPTHKNFRPCGNQVMRKFFVGLTAQERP